MSKKKRLDPSNLSHNTQSSQNKIQLDLLSLFGLLFFTVFLFIIKENSIPLIDPDEPRYAACAKEMIESGNWAIPYFNGIPRINKPPLFYWLTAISFKLFGISELASRLPSILFGIGGVVITFFWSKGIWGRKSAFWAGFILVVSPLYLCISRLCITDMVMSFFLYLCLYLFYRSYMRGYFRKRNRICLYASFAMVFMTKGHVGIVIFILVICTFLTIMKDLKFLNQLWSRAGCIIFAGLTLPWSLIFISNIGFNTIFKLVSHETYDRFVGGFQHPEPFYFYGGIFLAGFYPWSFFTLFAVFPFFKRKKRKRENGCLSIQDKSKVILENDDKQACDDINLKFFCSWFVVVIILFSVSRSKLFSYILPLSPTVPLIFLTVFNNIRHKNKNIQYIVILPILILMFCLSIVISLFLPKWISDKYEFLNWNFSFIAWTFSTCTGLSILMFIIKGINWCKYSLGFTSYLMLCIIAININTFIGNHRSTKEIVAKFLPTHDTEYTLLSYHKLPPSLVYYSGKVVRRIDDKIENSLKQAVEDGKNVYVYMTKKNYKRFEQNIAQFGLKLKGRSGNSVILTTINN